MGFHLGDHVLVLFHLHLAFPIEVFDLTHQSDQFVSLSTDTSRCIEG
jgi:hypothetical protein